MMIYLYTGVVCTRFEEAGTKACQFFVPSCHFYTHSVPLNPEVNVGVFFHIALHSPLSDKNGYIKSICLTYLFQYYQMVLIVCVIYYIEYYTHII